jgi:ABC-type multidrug transport system fused ATPase/permease subunit
MQNRKIDISAEVVAESLRLARANQVPGQNKEQTQLIAQGIQKGITEYKRAQKARQRLADKAKKQLRRQSNTTETDVVDTEAELEQNPSKASRFRTFLSWLPWLLLLLTWSGIILVGLR